MRQTWKRLKERGFTVVLWELLSLKTPLSCFERSPKGSKTVMKLLLFIPSVVFDQLILHLTYSMLLDCLLGWKISRLFQDTKTPVSARVVLTEARDQFHPQNGLFFSTDRTQIFGQVTAMFPSVLCLCDQPHVSMAWGTEGHSLFCINTWDSTLISETASRSHPYRAGN